MRDVDGRYQAKPPGTSQSVNIHVYRNSISAFEYSRFALR